MTSNPDWRQYAATITAALIARLPADQQVSPADAAALFAQVTKALIEAPEPKPGKAPSHQLIT